MNQYNIMKRACLLNEIAREFGQAIDTFMRDKPMQERMGTLERQQVLERWIWARSYQQLEKQMQMTLERYSG